MPEGSPVLPSVLHVAECFGGGVLEMVRLVAERSAAAGARHTIAYGRRPETPADPRSVIDRRVGLVELDWRRRSPTSQLAAALRLRALCYELQPDVVHLHSSFAAVVGVAALHGRHPAVYTPHAFASAIARRPPQRMAIRAMERLVARRVEVVGTVSNSEAALARELGARRVVSIPNGIPELDPGSLHMRNWAPGSARPRVVAAGRLIEQRRPVACARILGALGDVADVAWVGGGGPAGAARDQALAALTRVGAEPTGWQPRERVLDELGRATAYLHWTAWDGQALSLLEAIACGAVAVASDLAPNRELLDARQLCRTESDAVALLRRIVLDPEFAAELQDAQRKRAAPHSAEAMVRGWNDLYEDLAMARTRRQTPTDRAPLLA